MNRSTRTTDTTERARLAEAVRAGDETAFANLVTRHRRELHIHCYRMLGSLHDAEDAVQDTFLRAWKYRDSLKDDAPVRPWLYRIATNAALDAIARDRRRAEARAGTPPDSPGEITWLQPYPDRLLEPVAPREAEPDARVVTRESIELAFLTVIQLLTPQQRAALILRDVLGWSAKEAADLLEVSVAAANGALQRARATLQKHLPARKPEWPAGVDPTSAERALLQKYVQACESAELAGFEAIIREDAVFRMPPESGTTVGREAMIRLWQEGGFDADMKGRVRCMITRANLQPAVAAYMLRDDDWRPLAIDVLRIEEGMISEIITFAPDTFDAFGLPASLE